MDGKRKGFLAALAIGLAAAPALALAASGLLGGRARAGEPAAAVTAVTAVTATAGPATTPTTSAADLEAACTAQGMDLVAREEAGLLSGVQQAALDALRPICEAEGFTLGAAPPAPEIPASAAAAPPPAAGAQFDDGRDESEQGDGGEFEDHEDESGEEPDEHGSND